MPVFGAIHRYFGALSLPCKLLKTSDLLFSLQESRKLFTVFSQIWMTEIHTASRNATVQQHSNPRLHAEYYPMNTHPLASIANKLSQPRRNLVANVPESRQLAIRRGRGRIFEALM
jgi:hypothetical protein